MLNFQQKQELFFNCLNEKNNSLVMIFVKKFYFILIFWKMI